MTPEQLQKFEEEAQEVRPILENLFPLATLTKREFYAAMAMQGMLANKEQVIGERLVIDAVGYADRLIYNLADPKAGH